MGRKIFGILVCMLFIFTTFSTVSAIQEKKVFTNCYIEATGSIDFTWQLNDIPLGLRYRFISFWPIVFNEPDVDVTIYSKKNGDILWKDTFESGQWVLYLVGFIGKYNNDGSTDETLIANLDGRTCFVMISSDVDLKDDTNNKGFVRSTSSSVSINNIPSVNIPGRYRNCYLEISGYMHNDWPAVIKLPNMFQLLWIHQFDSDKVLFGLYSYILFEKDAMIKIYDEKDGDLLWQHEGIIDPLITLIGFSGDVVIDNTPYQLPYITLNGNTRFIGIKLNDFPDP
jgi:hypothetical protein